MYRIENPEYLQLLWLIPALWVLFVAYRLWQKRAQKRWGDARLLAAMTEGRSRTKPVLKMIYTSLAVALLVLALANPQVGSRTETVKREGVDLVFALDVSASMLAEDIAPSRLEKAKFMIAKSLENLGGDRVGIVAYAGKAYPLLPITTDYSAARMSLQSASPDFIPTPGTALDQALEYSLGYFDETSVASKVLVIMSDGEDHEDSWRTIAAQLRERGIIVLTMGFGTAQGGPIPERQGKTLMGYKRDRNNEVVVTRLNEDVLREVARETGGNYVNGAKTNQALAALKETLTGLNKAEIESRVYTDYDDQFQWFLAGAMLFLMLDIFTATRKSNWLTRLNTDVKKEEI